MSKKVPAEAMKILADALEEFGNIVGETFVIEDFKVVLNTHLSTEQNITIVVTENPERANEFDLEFQ